MNKKQIFGILTSSVFLLSSCFGDDEPESQLTACFTVHNSSNGAVLYMDGGNIIYPSSQSIYDLTSGKGLGDIKRAQFSLTYTDSNVTVDSDNKVTIREAKLISGSQLPLFDIIKSTEIANSKNILENDSIDDINSINVWAYRGYFNVMYNSNYIAKSQKAIAPSLNVIVEPNTMDPRQINVRIVNNMHKTDSKDLTAGNYTFTNSYDITYLQNNENLHGVDSLTLNISIDKCKVEKYKNFTFKIGYKDLFYPY